MMFFSTLVCFDYVHHWLLCIHQADNQLQPGELEDAMGVTEATAAVVLRFIWSKLWIFSLYTIFVNVCLALNNRFPKNRN